MTEAQKLLDTQGLVCPEPVMLLHSAVRDMQPGEVVKVLATDPSTTRDIPKFCQFLGHELLTSITDGEVLEFVIRKKERA